MRNILFRGKDFWPFPLLLAVGILFLLGGREGDALMFLLGLVTVVGTLGVFFVQVKNRIEILRSPDYEAMKEDLSDAQSFLNGRVYLGKKYLYSSFKGKVYRREAVSSLQQRVSRPPRSSPTADLLAWAAGEGEVVLARYSYEDAYIRQANALMHELEQAPEQAVETKAENSLPAHAAQTQAASPSEVTGPARTEAAASPPAGEPPLKVQPSSAEAPEIPATPEKKPTERSDSPTGEGFEDYVCRQSMAKSGRLFFAGSFELMLLFVLMFLWPVLSPHWIVIPVLPVSFGVFYLVVGAHDRLAQERSAERLRENNDAAALQKEFDAALRNCSDTLRLGDSVLFVRGLRRLIRYRSIHRAQRVSGKTASARPTLRMDVWFEGELKSTDLLTGELCFPLPDGKTMDHLDFVAFLRERNPQLEIGMPVID